MKETQLVHFLFSWATLFLNLNLNSIFNMFTQKLGLAIQQSLKQNTPDLATYDR